MADSTPKSTIQIMKMDDLYISCMYLDSLINKCASLLQEVKHPEGLTITPDAIAYQEAVLKEINEIKSNQKTILKSMNDLQKLYKFPTRKSAAVVADDDNEDDDYGFSDIKKLFPLSTLDQMKFVEEKLIDENIYNQMVTMLSQIGGVILDTGIKLMLRKLLTNEVAMQYSLLGARGKMPFKELVMYNAIYDTVRKNKLWQNYTDVQIEVAVTNWLRHARGRYESNKKKTTLSPE